MHHVAQDSEMLAGVPVFAGTRVPLGSLFDHLARGDSTEGFLVSFPSVTGQQVKALLEGIPIRGLAAWLHALPHKISHLTQVDSMMAKADRLQDETEERLHYDITAMEKEAQGPG